MAFVLKENQDVWWPVVVTEPADGGKVVKRKFQLRFALEDPVSWEQANNGEGELVTDVLARVVSDWKDVSGEDGEPIEFDGELFLGVMLSRAHIRQAIWNTYLHEVIAGAKPKN